MHMLSVSVAAETTLPPGHSSTVQPAPSTTGSATTSTTAPGSVVTIFGGPNATANIPGTHNDGSDFYGIGAALAAILVAIAITRLVFRRPRRTAPDDEDQPLPR